MGRPRQTITSNKNNILTRHLSSICGLSTASSKKDIASLDLIFHTSKKSSKGSCHFHHLNSFNKKINGINNVELLLQEKEKKKSFSNENKLHNKSRVALGEITDFNNRINNMKLSNEKEKEKKPAKVFLILEDFTPMNLWNSKMIERIVFNMLKNIKKMISLSLKAKYYQKFSGKI